MRKLGQGGMSSVFLAEDEQGRSFALKLLNLSLESEPEFRKRFQREAELTQRLSHPNIVKTLTWQDDPDVGVYLVMEYVAGGNLRVHLEENSQLWTVEHCVRLFAPVAAALDYAHAEKVVHRDLKPENLLFEGSDCLKIADFGVARVEHGSRLTRTGVLPGTPEYMAPEQFSDQVAGPAADVYSLATILYECLVGATPFRSENLAQVLQRQAFDKPQPPTQRREELPYYVDRVLLKALEKQPEQRYASAGQLLDALATPPASLPSRPSRPDAISELPTRYVSYKPGAAAPRGKSLPWGLVWLIWTLAGIAWCWRSLPPPIPPAWLDQALGWQPAPLGRQLCASVVWCGIEVALLEPTQQLKALERARFAAGLWGDWIHGEGPKSLRGAKDGDDYAISVAEGEWLRVDGQMAANLRATPEQVGEYWLALLEDVQAIRMGKTPNRVKDLERRRPLRLDGTPPRYPLLDRLYDRCRIQSREGQIDAQVMAEALRSLGNPDIRRLREAARSIPLPKP
ncbi:MAG: serine/threonine protein kinase [Candidatus Eremiobacteraeota bacterium]|nr:serine/threonine protein kinase [Candidatus Eremiobacteraeota bacterium]MCW5866040.1 serine/threonine protein kinase [Candidatus Eremiobacteraeota bacterium]